MDEINLAIDERASRRDADQKRKQMSYNEAIKYFSINLFEKEF